MSGARSHPFEALHREYLTKLRAAGLTFDDWQTNCNVTFATLIFRLAPHPYSADERGTIIKSIATLLLNALCDSSDLHGAIRAKGGMTISTFVFELGNYTQKHIRDTALGRENESKKIFNFNTSRSVSYTRTDGIPYCNKVRHRERICIGIKMLQELVSEMMGLAIQNPRLTAVVTIFMYGLRYGVCRTTATFAKELYQELNEKPKDEEAKAKADQKARAKAEKKIDHKGLHILIGQYHTHWVIEGGKALDEKFQRVLAAFGALRGNELESARLYMGDDWFAALRTTISSMRLVGKGTPAAHYVTSLAPPTLGKSSSLNRNRSKDLLASFRDAFGVGCHSCSGNTDWGAYYYESTRKQGELESRNKELQRRIGELEQVIADKLSAPAADDVNTVEIEEPAATVSLNVNANTIDGVQRGPYMADSAAPPANDVENVADSGKAAPEPAAPAAKAGSEDAEEPAVEETERGLLVDLLGLDGGEHDAVERAPRTPELTAELSETQAQDSDPLHELSSLTLDAPPAASTELPSVVHPAQSSVHDASAPQMPQMTAPYPAAWSAAPESFNKALPSHSMAMHTPPMQFAPSQQPYGYHQVPSPFTSTGAGAVSGNYNAYATGSVHGQVQVPVPQFAAGHTAAAAFSASWHTANSKDSFGMPIGSATPSGNPFATTSTGSVLGSQNWYQVG